jgi:hypothetical protein
MGSVQAAPVAPLTGLAYITGTAFAYQPSASIYMPSRYENYHHAVMTLDARGTNPRFSAIRGNRLVAGTLRIATEVDNLKRRLANAVCSFHKIRSALGKSPAAVAGTAARLPPAHVKNASGS